MLEKGSVSSFPHSMVWERILHSVAISNVQISLIFPGLEFLVRTNVRVSGDSARRALSNGVCNTIYD